MSSMESGGSKHVKGMMSSHGCPDHRRVHGGAAKSRTENENSENKGMERRSEREERKDG